MKPILQRVWKEPAVFIGLLTSIVLAILAIITSAHWDASLIVGIVAPLASSLGIRSLVTPTTPTNAADADDG